MTTETTDKTSPDRRQLVIGDDRPWNRDRLSVGTFSSDSCSKRLARHNGNKQYGKVSVKWTMKQNKTFCPDCGHVAVWMTPRELKLIVGENGTS